ncbi:hypothetical protein PF003_g13340 [Phytophthora fragariae]|nr:hypothetical protein PF003_g13335 [Phytophthora fragariae]KAE8902715.1 hypothetical protein PF003_g13340 [Phytophthora fragariae]
MQAAEKAEPVEKECCGFFSLAPVVALRPNDSRKCKQSHKKAHTAHVEPEVEFCVGIAVCAEVKPHSRNQGSLWSLEAAGL